MIKRLKKLWQHLSSTSLGRYLFAKILGYYIPYTATINAKIITISNGYAKVSIKDDHRNKNHLHCIHAIAIANLGELASGLALHFAMKDDERAILTKIETQYLKKARGTIYAEAQCLKPILGENMIKAAIVDPSNDTLALVTATWQLDHKPCNT